MSRAHKISLILCVAISILCVRSVNVSANTAQELGQDYTVSYKSVTVNNAVLAKQNWLLNCQGCHKEGAIGLEPDMPNLNGRVSKFLHVDSGIEYIGRINGIANAPLSNNDLADLVNWMFVTYDPGHIPDDFLGFTPQEIGNFRKTPQNFDILNQRERLVHAIEKLDTKTVPRSPE